MLNIKEMNKEIDISIEKFFCSKCNGFHKRIFRKKLNYKFFEHFKLKIEVSEIKHWKLGFNKNWNKYNINKHKLSSSSKKQ